jgi:hypothetical protein
MTKIRRIALVLASGTLAIGGLASLNPLAAQAKAVNWLPPETPMAACFGAPGSATGYVKQTGPDAGTYKIVVTGDPGNFEFRARYGYFDAKQKKMLYTKAKAVNPAGDPTTYNGSLSAQPQLVIFRLDVVDVAAEQLVYTSDGAVGCD